MNTIPATVDNKIVNRYTIEELEKVPALSNETVKYLNEPALGPLNIGIIAYRLKNLTAELEYVQKHRIKNAVVAITRSVLTLGIAAADVLGVLYSGFPIIGGVAAAAIYSIVVGEHASSNRFYIDYNIWELGFLVVGAPFFPIVSLCSREERLKGSINAHNILASLHLKQREKIFTQDMSAVINKLKLAIVDNNLQTARGFSLKILYSLTSN